MTWTATKTWVVGDRFTSADANTYLRDDMQYTRDVVREGFETWELPAPDMYTLGVGSYWDIGGAGFTWIPFTKRQADTRLKMRYMGSCWVTPGAIEFQVGARISPNVPISWSSHDGQIHFINTSY